MKFKTTYQILNLCFLTLIITIGQNIKSQAQCDIDDWTALKALYENTNGNNWKYKFGWEQVTTNNPPPNCDLATVMGVSLNTSRRVVEIKLWLNDLTGELPSSIDKLQHLKSLDLFYNQIGGKIPAAIGNLTELTYLGLYFNQFTGEIPSTIGNLSNLSSLHLESNQLTGKIPNTLGNLFTLSHLELGGNQLEGTIPNELGNLLNLRLLLLSGNNFTGTIPSTLGNLLNLTNLSLSGNNLTGGIPAAIGNLQALKNIDLESNGLSGIIPNEIGNLTNLVELDFSKNQLSGQIPAELENLDRLQKLLLSVNELSGNIPVELGNMSSLKYLYLSANKLSGTIPPSLGNLSNLENLLLSDNQLTGSIPPQLGNLHKLIRLYLNNNQLENTIPPELGNLDALKWFFLNDNNLTGSLPSSLQNLNQLFKLRTQNNQLSGLVPAFPSTFTELDIANNYFTCADVDLNFNNNQQIETFNFTPQNYLPQNYASIQYNVIDSIDIGMKSLLLTAPITNNNGNTFSYQWRQNDQIIAGANSPSLNLNNITNLQAGIYTLHLSNNNCQSNIIQISEPIYVIVEGYDLYGEPVQYNQLMVEFDSKEDTKLYENEILIPNAGLKEKACNCNRELYLWQFPSTDAAAAALVAIDQKIKRIRAKNELKGGFNNNFRIKESNISKTAYNITSESFNNNYADSVTVFILDSGFDEQNHNAAPFLFDQASVDSCYDVESSPGYSYVDSSISSNYVDDVWHGTFGFRSITSGMEGKAKLKVVPLKVFNENGEGNLFDLTCALYHAIDHYADIINISAGFQGEPSAILESAINFARKKGIFVIAAAGNDTLNIDNLPQYPAYYAGQYFKFDTINQAGELYLDSILLDNVISVASVNTNDSLSVFSNYGKQSVSIAAYGSNIHSYGLAGFDVVASGTSMSTFFATKALALEIASNNKREYQKIWQDFEMNWLISNPLLVNKTQTGKQINFNTAAAEIEGCTDQGNCNYFPFATIEDGSCIPVFIDLPNLSDETSNFYLANDSISSNSIIEPFDTIIYKSGKLIRLENGFSVEKGADFTAEVENCD